MLWKNRLDKTSKAEIPPQNPLKEGVGSLTRETADFLGMMVSHQASLTR